MKKRMLISFLFFAVPFSIFAQTSALTPKQIETIQSALQRIVISNNSIENIIYDGMTYREVITILGISRLEIIPIYGIDSLDYLFGATVGKYILFFSSPSIESVVIGYALRERKSQIYHNRI